MVNAMKLFYLISNCNKEGGTKHYTQTLQEVVHVRVALNFSLGFSIQQTPNVMCILLTKSSQSSESSKQWEKTHYGTKKVINTVPLHIHLFAFQKIIEKGQRTRIHLLPPPLH